MKQFSGVQVAAFLGGLLMAFGASAQTPRANGETLNIQIFPGSTVSIHPIIAKEKGFCEKYNFKCELKTISSGIVALQALIGKSVDVAMTGTELAASSVAAGSDVVLVAMPIPNNVMTLAARNDVPIPNQDKGYPAVIKDLKGLRIGVTARGSQAEVWLQTMLREGGLKPSDVTVVGVGGPAAAYTALVASKQIDAVVVFEPLKSLCRFEKKCKILVDLTVGEGPAIVKKLNGAAVPYAMRREMVEGSPALMAAYYAAMTDAANWFNAPENFEEVLRIFTPFLGFKEMPNSEQFLRIWVASELPTYSKDLKINRNAVRSTIDFYHNDAKTLDKLVDVDKLVWSKAP